VPYAEVLEESNDVSFPRSGPKPMQAVDVVNDGGIGRHELASSAADGDSAAPQGAVEPGPKSSEPQDPFWAKYAGMGQAELMRCYEKLAEAHRQAILEAKGLAMEAGAEWEECSGWDDHEWAIAFGRERGTGGRDHVFGLENGSGPRHHLIIPEEEFPELYAEREEVRWLKLESDYVKTMGKETMERIMEARSSKGLE
jgi:hypothetical protein